MRLAHLRSTPARLVATTAIVALLACFAQDWAGQDWAGRSRQASAQVPGGFSPLNLGGGAPEPTGPIVTAKGVIIPPADGKPAQLSITAEMLEGWHIYSLTQGDGGPIRSSIKIPPSPDYKIGEFKPVQEPHSELSPEFKIVVETHDEKVTWIAPLDLSPGVDLAKLSIAGAVNAQACSNVCHPPKDFKFTATVAGATPATTSAATTSVSTVTPSSATSPSAGPPLPSSFGPPAPSSVTTSSAPSSVGGPPLPSGLDAFTVPAGSTNSATTGAPAIPGAAGDSQLVYKASLSHATWTGNVAPGAGSNKATISFRAESAPEWHVYVMTDVVPEKGSRPTLFAFNETSSLKVGKPAADQKPIASHGEGTLDYFENAVVFTSEVEVPAGTKPGDYRIAGVVGFQTCNRGSSCDPPRAANFETVVKIGADGIVAAAPVRFTGPADYNALAKQINAAAPIAASAASNPLADLQVQSEDEKSSLPYALAVAFLAGFILNFMPCVLPVIGLKVLSFVEQSGHDRKKILTLNIWYALGMLTVFWALAAVAIVLRVWFDTTFGWGQQFGFYGFTITLVVILFVMALSFLGVWEIPIPGFAGSNNAQKLASKEGVSGAYAKGIITTLVATPCSGPGLATAVGFALKESPPVTMAVFTSMGLGMAAPYLAIAMKPSLLRFLPKPGEWMDTFKQIMGFVLLGTVVFFLSSLPAGRLVPTITLLFGLWAACWWIGRVPVYAEPSQKLRAWAGATVWGALIGWFAFSPLQGIIDYRIDRFVDSQLEARVKAAASAKAAPNPDTLDWKHFTFPQFNEAFAKKQTVLVDFTADWCTNCKFLKAANLDRKETKTLVEQLGVVAFEADTTSRPPELIQLLEQLNPAGSVPVIAIFPAETPNRPLVFSNGYTQGQILEALKKAGPSKPQTAEAPKPATEKKSADAKQADPDRLNWYGFSFPELEAARRAGKTILIDFTADWNSSVKVLQATALDRPETKRLVEELGVVTFSADMTKPSLELRDFLEKLNPIGNVPTVAIFPAADFSRPIVFRDGYNQAQILEGLKLAGPSKPATTEASKIGMR